MASMLERARAELWSTAVPGRARARPRSGVHRMVEEACGRWNGKVRREERGSGLLSQRVAGCTVTSMGREGGVHWEGIGRQCSDLTFYYKVEVPVLMC